MNLVRKTPKGAAGQVISYLRKKAATIDYDPSQIILCDPDKSARLGYGRCWTILWEEGPYDWTMITSGCSFLGPSFGKYSEVGDWPDGIYNDHVHCEPYNSHVLCFYSSRG